MSSSENNKPESPTFSLTQTLQTCDAYIDVVDQKRLSLNPSKQTATRFSEFLPTIEERLPEALTQIFCEGLQCMVAALVKNFPENIFWDFDFLIGDIIQKSNATPREQAKEEIKNIFQTISALQPIYGIHSKVHFRYTHDFLYGFDWAKWVRKSPNERSQVGPFDLVLLHALLQRGNELLELIAANDTKYSQLSEGEIRNPFSFSREPKDEIKLFLSLSKENLIPVQAWLPNGRTNHQHDFQTLRKAKAEQLNQSF